MSDYPQSHDNISKPSPTTDRNSTTGISPANTVSNLIEIVNVLMWKLGLGTEVNFTADSGTDTFTSSSHGLSDGDILILTTTNTLPTGVSTLTRYYVVNKTTNTFQLAVTHGGSVVSISDNGTGTHSFTLLLGVGRFLTGNASGVGAYNKDVPTGDVVGTTDTQDVSNKTLTAPKMAAYDAIDTAGGIDALTIGYYGTPVNGLVVEMGETGNGPVLYPSGETNQNLNLSGAGTGGVSAEGVLINSGLVDGVDVSGVANDATATLTDKTIDADNNTITNIGTSELKDKSVTGEKLGTPVAFRAYAGSNHTPSTTATIVQIDTEDYDHGSDFDTGTYKFTAPYAGIYSFNAAVHCTVVGSQIGSVRLYKNTTQAARGVQIESSATSHNQSYVVASDIELAASDTVEVRFVLETSGAGRSITAGTALTYFTGHLVGRTA